MAQKALFKKANKVQKKAGAANRHGKTPRTRKGTLVFAPKNSSVAAAKKQQSELTKVINKRNEEAIAGLATKSHNRLQVVKQNKPADQ